MRGFDFVRYEESDVAFVGLTNEGVVFTEIKVSNAFDIEHSKQLIKIREEVGGRQKRRVLYTTNVAVLFPTEEVLNMLVSKERTRYISAEAYVVKSLQQRLEGMLYLKSMKPKLPVQFFATEQEAMDWLLSL